MVLLRRDYHLLWIIYKTNNELGCMATSKVRPQRLINHIQGKTEQLVTLRLHWQGHAEIWSSFGNTDNYGGGKRAVRDTSATIWADRETAQAVIADALSCEIYLNFHYLMHTSLNTLGCLTRVGQDWYRGFNSRSLEGHFFGHAQKNITVTLANT